MLVLNVEVFVFCLTVISTVYVRSQSKFTSRINARTDLEFQINGRV